MERQAEAPRKGNVKVQREIAQLFSARARKRGMKQDAYLRHLMELDQQAEGAAVYGPGGELLVTYNAIIHQPIRVTGTVEKWSPPVEEPEGEDDTESESGENGVEGA